MTSDFQSLGGLTLSPVCRPVYRHKDIPTTCESPRPIATRCRDPRFSGMRQFVIGRRDVTRSRSLHTNTNTQRVDEGSPSRGNFPFCCVTVSCFWCSDNRAPRGEGRRRLRGNALRRHAKVDVGGRLTILHRCPLTRAGKSSVVPLAN